METPSSHQSKPQVEEGMVKTCLKAINPLALEHQSPPHPRMSREEQKACRLAQRKYVQPFRDAYITRSGRIMATFFFLYSFAGLILPMTYLVAFFGIAMLTSLAHLVFLIFYKQVIDDSVGAISPEEPVNDDEYPM